MFRKFVSIALVVSLMALASSGLLMIFLNDFAFQLKMHPVHKIFGIIMSVAGLFHVYFNFGQIKKYLGIKKLAVGFGVLCLMLAGLYTVGLNKPIDQQALSEIEAIMPRLEKH